MKNEIKVGWIGLGAMGTPMTNNLLKAGFSLNVYNRTKSKTDDLVVKGAVAYDQATDLWKDSDIIAIMVSNDKACQDILSGPDGILENPLAKGKTLVNISTISPAVAAKIAEAADKKGIHYLAAPVSGSAGAAATATLLFLIGGEKEILEKFSSVFDALGKKSYYLGDVTAGNKAKLAINYLVAINYQAIAETVLFANEMGIDKAAILDIINNSGVGNITTKIKTEPIIKDDFNPIAFSLENMLKDVKLAHEQGNDFPLMHGLLPSYTEAVESGLGKKDVMEIIHYLAQSKN